MSLKKKKGRAKAGAYGLQWICKSTHSNNPGEKNRQGGEGTEMVVDVEEMGNCSVDHVSVPSSIALYQQSYAKDLRIKV